MKEYVMSYVHERICHELYLKKINVWSRIPHHMHRLSFSCASSELTNSIRSCIPTQEAYLTSHSPYALP